MRRPNFTVRIASLNEAILSPYTKNVGFYLYTVTEIFKQLGWEYSIPTYGKITGLKQFVDTGFIPIVYPGTVYADWLHDKASGVHMKPLQLADRAINTAILSNSKLFYFGSDYYASLLQKLNSQELIISVTGIFWPPGFKTSLLAKRMKPFAPQISMMFCQFQDAGIMSALRTYFFPRYEAFNEPASASAIHVGDVLLAFRVLFFLEISYGSCGLLYWFTTRQMVYCVLCRYYVKLGNLFAGR